MRTVVILFAIIILSATCVSAQDGKISLYANSSGFDCDADIGFGQTVNIYLFYTRDEGPEMGKAYQFKLLKYSSNVIFQTPTWPPGAMTIGNIETGITIVTPTCLGPGNKIWLGTIPVLNVGEMGTFYIRVVADPSAIPPGILITECTAGDPVHEVRGGTFVFNGDCAFNNLLYVKADGSGDAPTIQAAIDISENGDTVLVAPGTYTGTGNRELDFLGKPIIVIAESSYDDSVTSPSIIYCEDHKAFYFHTNEDTTSIVDGFEIEAGFGFEVVGVQCVFSSPTIRNNWIHGSRYAVDADTSNLIVENNVITNLIGSSTEGIKCSGGSPIIRNNTIDLGNESSAGIWCLNDASATITGNTITINGGDAGIGIEIDYSTAIISNNDIGPCRGEGGHGIRATYSNLTITDNDINDNGSWYPYTTGSALYCDNSTVTMQDNEIHGNISEYGYAIYIDNSPYSNISNNNITGNESGGIKFSGHSSSIISGNSIEDNIYLDGIYTSSSITISNNRIIGNNVNMSYPLYNHCGIACYSCSPTISGNVILGNEGMDGGGIYCESSSPDITSNTIAGNVARRGSGIFIDSGSNPSIENNIVAFNTRYSVAYSGFGIYTQSSPLTINCCDVYGNDNGNYFGITDPTGSAGNISVNPLFCNLAGEDVSLYRGSPCLASSNPSCGLIGALDMGCSSGLETWVVNPAGGGDFQTIQAAIDASYHGDIVELVNATYTGDGNRDLDYHGKAITVRSQSGDPASCIIDCQANSGDLHRGFFFNDNEDSTSILQNVTITGGYHTGGGAIQCDGAWPTVENCVFTQNTSSSDGGAVYCTNSAQPTFRYCTITNNTSNDDGGALQCRDNANAYLFRCLLANNTANDDGGAIYLTVSGYATLYGCTIYNNQAPDLGGGICAVTSSSITLINTIVASNGTGSAVHCIGATAALTCCDVYGNTGGDYVGCIAGQNGVNGNISADPVFCGAPTGNLTLDWVSPCLPENNSCGVRIGCYGQGCTITAIGALEELPVVLDLKQNYPNPFNPTTKICYDVPKDGATLTIKIFDAGGRVIRTLVNGHVAAGKKSTNWNGTNDHGNLVSSGIYFCRLQAGTKIMTRKLVLLK